MSKPTHLVRTLSLTLLTLARGPVGLRGRRGGHARGGGSSPRHQARPRPYWPVISRCRDLPGAGQPTRPSTATRTSRRCTRRRSTAPPAARRPTPSDISPLSKSFDQQGLFVEWADQWRRNERQCTGGTLKVDIWSSAFGDLWLRREGSFEAPLRWDAQKQLCDYGYVELYHKLYSPEDWYVAVVMTHIRRAT